MSPWSLLRQVAPIDALPVELIAYIFILATHGPSDHETDEKTPVNLDSITTPLVLSTINKRWRNIALSTSALWTTLCVTIQNVVNHCDAMDPGSSELDTTGLTTYLSLSRKYPVDILIDSRDPHWDFTEDDISVTAGLRSSYVPESDYTHPFTGSHMTSALAVLLPHVQRWRSLTILTDTWAPMNAALSALGYGFSTSNAPRLESLTLMRCNEFASYSDFHPAHLKDPSWLPFGRDSMTEDDKNPLPCLRSLNLQGVHVKWNALPFLFPSSTAIGIQSGLRHLDLRYHSSDVRPSTREFCNILRACPDLCTLSVVVSGPSLETDLELLPIPLPNLEQLHLGYTTARDACHMLSMLNAPNLKELTLEDATHVASLFVEDAGDILQYLGTSLSSFTNNGIAGNAPAAQDGLSDEPSTSSSASPSSTTAVQRSLFPHLQTVTLTRVQASADAFAAFFDAQRDLQHLELVYVSNHALPGLLPWQSYTDPGVVVTSPCPCPNLRTLCVRAAHIDVGFITRTLPQQRTSYGARLLEDVDVYVEEVAQSDCAECVWDDDSVDSGDEDESVDEKCGAIDQSIVVEVDHCTQKWGTGTAVKVFHPPAILEPVGDFEMHCELDSAGDPFALGGAFNDPAFDEYYANHRFWT